MAYIVMAHIGMACIVMVYIAMACKAGQNFFLTSNEFGFGLACALLTRALLLVGVRGRPPVPAWQAKASLR